MPLVAYTEYISEKQWHNTACFGRYCATPEYQELSSGLLNLSNPLVVKDNNTRHAMPAEIRSGFAVGRKIEGQKRIYC